MAGNAGGGGRIDCGRGSAGGAACEPVGGADDVYPRADGAGGAGDVGLPESSLTVVLHLALSIVYGVVISFGVSHIRQMVAVPAAGGAGDWCLSSESGGGYNVVSGH